MQLFRVCVRQSGGVWRGQEDDGVGLLGLQLSGAQKVELWVRGVRGVEDRTFQKEAVRKQKLREAGEGIPWQGPTSRRWRGLLSTLAKSGNSGAGDILYHQLPINLDVP